MRQSSGAPGGGASLPRAGIPAAPRLQRAREAAAFAARSSRLEHQSYRLPPFISYSVEDVLLRPVPPPGRAPSGLPVSTLLGRSGSALWGRLGPDFSRRAGPRAGLSRTPAPVYTRRVYLAIGANPHGSAIPHARRNIAGP